MPALEKFYHHTHVARVLARCLLIIIKGQT